MSEFIVIVDENDYDRHHRQYTHTGFTEYEDAVACAKYHTKCTDNGRMVDYTSTIYEVVRHVEVSMKRKTGEHVLTEMHLRGN